MKYLIFELFSGVGFCNQIFSLETAIYLGNITNRKLILLIKNPLCHCGKATWDYGYLLNFFTSDFLEFLPNGFEVYYNKIDKDIDDIINNQKLCYKLEFKNRFSNIVFIDDDLNTDDNKKDINDFCHYREKVFINFDKYNEHEYIFINKTNASRCFYNFYTTKENYKLMRNICSSLKFKPLFYEIAENIYNELNKSNNSYNIFVHLRFGDYHKNENFVKRFNKNIIKNLSEYFEGHKTNMITPKIYILVDNKNNHEFFNSMKKFRMINIETLTSNFIKNYLQKNRMIFYDFNIPKNYEVYTAILEMILSSKADQFIGTNTSTFSNYIQYLRFCKNKSYYNYCNLSANNFQYCRYLPVNNCKYDWIKYKYSGGHPVSWHMFWNVNYDNIDNKILYTIHGKTDGFGSQLQACFSLIAYCQYKGYEYIHTPMYSMHHNEGNIKNFPKYMNDFIYLENKYRSINDLTNYELTKLHQVKEGAFVHGSLNPHFFYNKSCLVTLREIYYNKPKPEIQSFQANKKNVALHIRRGDVNNIKYPIRFTSNNDYIKLLDKLNLDKKSHKIHIFSEGKDDDFKDIELHFKDFEFAYHVNENIQLTFHSLVKADILILARSSFSYCTALLNENRIIANFIERWWHKPLKDWEII